MSTLAAMQTEAAQLRRLIEKSRNNAERQRAENRLRQLEAQIDNAVKRENGGRK